MEETRELDHAVKAYMTYEDYLDSMLTKDDLMYLEDKEMCRELLSLGFHSNRRIISREVFDKKKAEIEAQTKDLKSKELKISSRGVEITDKLLQELAKREEDNLTGCLATIIFLRTENNKGEEVSAYVDFSQRLKTEDWSLYFTGKEKLTPKLTDLSFYNWNKDISLCNSNRNFDVVPDTNTLKLSFICKSDGCTIHVNSKERSSRNVFRMDLFDTDFSQAAIFDHVVDRPIP
ncbi:hypothetical protein JTE90_026004 [Oedothorax gibbosus]|uniref:Cilia- and flagella-associated protein 299 n=1 Tax=Oedothorax gibbosus TaxID=931172 RepID=A0AAV6UGH7_9ARAC|nr:hypothetical protein JTE90_026004 [Oedothorax gibbosus]